MDNSKQHTKYQGVLPSHDATILVIEPDGSVVACCSYAGITRADITSFLEERIEYGLFEYRKHYPLAILLFRFPPPLGGVELPFDMRQFDRDTQAAFLKEKSHRIEFILVERKTRTIRQAKTREIAPALVDSLHAVASDQLLYGDSYSFESELDALYLKFPLFDDLWKYARRF